MFTQHSIPFLHYDMRGHVHQIARWLLPPLRFCYQLFRVEWRHTSSHALTCDASKAKIVLAALPLCLDYISYIRVGVNCDE